MKGEKEYMRDIAEIRSMMERSSRFLSLSGWAGIMAGVYALVGAYIAYEVFDFNPRQTLYPAINSAALFSGFSNVMFLAIIVLILAVGTAIFLSAKKAQKRGEKLWNPAAKRVLIHMSVPLMTGGLLVLILIANGLICLIAPVTCLFYGLALYNAGNFTYREVKSLGLIQIVLGLMGAYFVAYGLLFWALGFGGFHIIYGVYMHYRYER
jgi:uncharacterized membrane protein YidH (DUF202 family)